MQLCDAFGLPMLSLCDTPGFMVGPGGRAAPRGAPRLPHVRRRRAPDACRSFTIVLRKGYGLGAQAMAGGGFHAPLFTVAWPTGEFGGMGLEGAVRLGYRSELEAIADAAARERAVRASWSRSLRARQGDQHGAPTLEIDDVIDPADTRRWIVATLGDSAGEGSHRYVDTW